jgi:predicted DNA-binding antitoxin AbrB/MazE fold protein
MLKTVKTRCVNGALTPLEPVELREGAEYLITLDALPASSHSENAGPAPSTAGAWQKDDEYWEGALRTIYEARRSGSRVEPEP